MNLKDIICTGIGPLEEELSARMEDLRRFEEMLLASKEKTRDAVQARDKLAEQMKVLRSDNDLLKEKLFVAKVEALKSELQSIKERDVKLGQRLTTGHKAIAQ
eukprot:748379-Hanusia_phi.AAC.4